MRNETSDSYSVALTKAFVRSRMSVAAFISYLELTRPIFDIRESAFFIVLDGSVVHFYFADNVWYAKF